MSEDLIIREAECEEENSPTSTNTRRGWVWLAVVFAIIAGVLYSALGAHNSKLAAKQTPARGNAASHGEVAPYQAKNNEISSQRTNNIACNRNQEKSTRTATQGKFHATTTMNSSKKIGQSPLQYLVLHFRSNQSRLIREDEIQLDSWMNRLHSTAVVGEIAGYTDSVGASTYNQKLSLQRAKSVLTYIKRTKLTFARQLQIRGYGELNPVKNNRTRMGRSANRRVVITLSKVTTKK